MSKIQNRRIVVVNQAANYLTIGICNAFADKFKNVSLITGSIHEQGEKLNSEIHVNRINKWHEKPVFKKLSSYCLALVTIYWLLLFKYRNYEVFFVSIPPMAYLLKVVLPNRCSMLIWDVYPDVFKITGMKETHVFYRTWAYLNNRVFKKAFRVFTIGERMADLLSQYMERDKILIQPLWSISQDRPGISRKENSFVRNHNLQDKFVVQYSGNIGLTHNVEVLIEIAELLKDEKHILFQIIGRGPRAKVLKTMVEERKLDNCQFLPFQSDEMFPYSLSAANLGVVILNDLTSKGSVPSKAYNIMRFAVPSIYIASDDSELSEYCEKFKHGKCFNATDLENASRFILQLSQDEILQKSYSVNALKASECFTRANADNLVNQYLKPLVFD